MENERNSEEDEERRANEGNRNMQAVREGNTGTQNNTEGDRNTHQSWRFTVNFLISKSPILILLWLLFSLIYSYVKIRKLREEFFEIFLEKFSTSNSR